MVLAMMGVVAVAGILIFSGCIPFISGDSGSIFTSTYRQNGAGTSSNTEPKYNYVVRTEWITVDNSYIDPRYNQLFERLNSSIEIQNSAGGFTIDYKNVTTDSWSKFCKLAKEDDEFNTYAGQLLYSQYKNDNNNEQNQRLVLRDVYEYRLILNAIGLKEQDKFNFLREGMSYTQTEWCACDNINKEKLIYSNDAYKALLNYFIQSGNFSDEGVDWQDNVNFCDVIKKTVNGSLKFWDYKKDRKFEEYKGKQPLRLLNGERHCWVQAGAQILIASTANDDLTIFGNWGRFVKRLSDIQSNDRNKSIDFLDELKKFCYSGEFDLNECSRAEANNQIKRLDEGGTAQTATDILLNIFTKLKSTKFDTKKTVFEQPCDPILSEGVATDKKTYLPADTAIRHLIPGLKNVNAGIGSDPQGVNNIPNQYAQYKIEYSIDNKLMIYELRGMALTEHLAKYKKIPANETFDKKDRYKVETSLHARSVIKLDNSHRWHYCDSNRIYFMEQDIKDIFYNSKSILDYVTKYQNNKPANHADLLMYELVI